MCFKAMNCQRSKARPVRRRSRCPTWGCCRIAATGLKRYSTSCSIWSRPNLLSNRRSQSGACFTWLFVYLLLYIDGFCIHHCHCLTYWTKNFHCISRFIKKAQIPFFLLEMLFCIVLFYWQHLKMLAEYIFLLKMEKVMEKVMEKDYSEDKAQSRIPVYFAMVPS